MIYTLTLNPSLDYIVTVDKLNLGKTNRSIEDHILPGGKGINVSMVLKNLGFENKAIGFLAGFTGQALKAMVEKEGIEADFIDVKKGDTRINVKIRGIQETEINGMGPAISDEEIGELFKKLDDLTSEDILIISGSIPASLPQSLYKDIMKKLESKNMTIVVDASKELLINVLECHPFLIKPNDQELEEIFNTEIKNLDDVLFYAKKLQEKGARNVLISMGGRGAMLVSENGEVYHSKAPKGKLVNSVGAGDSMVAGFMAGYLKNRNYKDAFENGVCTGSASAFSEALATKEEVEALLKANEQLFENDRLQ